MTAEPLHHVNGGKRALAAHLRLRHRVHDWSAVPLEHWSDDELRAEHREAHEGRRQPAHGPPRERRRMIDIAAEGGLVTTATRVVVDMADGTRTPILPEGTRVRSRSHPELTGYIKGWEYNRPGVVSPIPYCIGWDDSRRACDLLGWLFVYQSDKGVEPVE